MEPQNLELKVWILLGVVSFLWVLLVGIIGVAISLGKSFVNRVLAKMDELIRQVQELKNKDTGLEKDVLSIQKDLVIQKEEIEKVKAKHEKCKNYKPAIAG